MQNNKVLFAVAGLFVVLLSWPVDTKATLDKVPLVSEEVKTFPSVNESAPAAQGSSDISFIAANRLVKDYADRYWARSYVRCDASKDRWFGIEVSKDIEIEESYIEIAGLRPITTIPFRDNAASERNKEWTAVSVIKGESYRWCKISAASCEDYKPAGRRQSNLGVVLNVWGLVTDPSSPVFSEEIFTKLILTIKKGVLTSDDPLKDRFAPKCADVKKHPIWIEP